MEITMKKQSIGLKVNHKYFILIICCLLFMNGCATVDSFWYREEDKALREEALTLAKQLYTKHDFKKSIYDYRHGELVNLVEELKQEQQQQQEEAEYAERLKKYEEAKAAELKKQQEVEASDQTHAEKPYTNSIGIEFVLIPAGSFTWAAEVKESKNVFGETVQETTPARKVTISKPFYLGKYEVTQEQWYAVMGDNPAKSKGRTNPVEQVSWEDAQRFISRLNQKEGHNRYRLPTEAEWEHAARAGTSTEYFFGDNESALGQYAWFKGNSGGKAQPVGQKQPNPWGLYDIYGNVFEWVQDWYGAYPESNVTDPRGSSYGSNRVLRGCCWYYAARGCRSAYRDRYSPGSLDCSIGFRLVLSTE
jgi:formylglycine-generating enzyme required for sulfatase activity